MGALGGLCSPGKGVGASPEDPRQALCNQEALQRGWLPGNQAESCVRHQRITVKPIRVRCPHQRQLVSVGRQPSGDLALLSNSLALLLPDQGDVLVGRVGPLAPVLLLAFELVVRGIVQALHAGAVLVVLVPLVVR